VKHSNTVNDFEENFSMSVQELTSP